MTLALLFGSFDPIHTGHIKVIMQTYREVVCDEIRLVVQPINNFKGEPQASLKDRLIMAQLAVKDLSYVRVFELSTDIPPEHSITGTLQKLKTELEDVDLILLLGQDLASSFARWPDYDQIMQLCRMVIIERTESDVSSSKIRQFAGQGQPITGMVLPEVESYILKHRLYS